VSVEDDDEVTPEIDEVIHLAFQIPEESGVELLLRLGAYDVWRGDLAEMRGDVPASAVTSASAPPVSENLTRAEQLYDALLMKKGFEYLQPRCLETLRLRFAEGRDIDVIAKQLETTPRYAGKLIHDCRRRIYEIISSIKAVSSLDASDDASRVGTAIVG
jgi:hypothetical protein